MDRAGRYEQAMQPARRRFADDPALRLVGTPEIGPSQLEAFLIYWSAFGAAMTEPVEGWIRRAGEACLRLGGPGVEALGAALRKHATAEADHHLLMIADLRLLCARRAAAGRAAPDPDELLAAPLPEPVRRYRQLHEDVIAGPDPYAQIGIESEIELLSVVHGPALMRNVGALLGGDVAAGLSFLREHVALDVAHSAFNRRQLAAFLDERPAALPALVTAGTQALDAYRGFLAHCVRLAAPTPAHTS